MKKTVLMLMVAGLFAAMPALAAEHGMMSSKEQAQRCAEQNEAIGKKIERLQGEIKKGKTTYTAEELRKLEEKLNEANAMLDSITKP
jgi:nicotinic acid mononucleotide adenylyltransferase